MNEYQIKKEHDDFKQLSGRENFGIRNHYVRFDNETFAKMNKAGYLFDSTYFNKDKTELVNPYKVGNMWEFPLHIMDVYVCKQGALEAGLKSTFSIIREAERRNLKYCTILFHDYQFDKTFDPDRMEWYIRTIEFCEKVDMSLYHTVMQLRN